MRLHKRIIFSSAAILVFAFSLLSFAQELSLPVTGEVNSSGINLRTDATTNSSIICLLEKSEQVEIVLELYDWYKIRLPKRAPAYIKKNLALCTDYNTVTAESNTPPPVPEPERHCQIAKIIKDKVNIRLKPSESSAILGKLNTEQSVKVVEDSEGWLRIEPTENCFGWVHKKFINKIPLADKQNTEAVK